MPWKPIHPIICEKKICTQCKIEKDVKEFHLQRSSKNGYRPLCKGCQNFINKKYYTKNRQEILKRAREYGKTEKRKKYCRDRAREKLKEKRDSEASRPRPLTCEACDGPPDLKGVVWDHDHTTGIFRGWLCNRCNRVLGMCSDSLSILNGLIKYLEGNV